MLMKRMMSRWTEGRLIWAVGGFVILLMIVWQNVHATRLKKEVRLLRAEADQLVVANARYNQTIQAFISESHLDRVARTNLQMKPIALDSVRTLPKA